MTSGKYFSNLLREEMRLQSWLTALSSVIFFFALPISCLLMIQADSYSANTRRMLAEYLCQRNPVLGFLLAVLSVMAAMSAFGYLFSRSRTDLYHALPLRRLPAFCYRYLAGLLAVLPAFLVNLALSVVFVAVSGHFSALSMGQLAFRTACYAILFLLSYATAVLAVTLCGNLFIALCAVGVFNGALPVLVLGLPSAFATFHPTFYYDNVRFFNLAKVLSPILQLFRNQTAVSLLAFAGAAVILSALAGLVYRLRPSEGAGKALAFPLLHAPVKYLVMVLLTLLCALFFQSIANPDYATAWFCFGLLAGALLSHALMEMLLEFDVAAFKQHLRGLAVFCAVTAAIAAFVICDPTGYDSYLPERSEIAGAAVSLSTLPEPYYSMGEASLLAAPFREKENVDAVYQMIRSRLPAGEDDENGDYWPIVVRLTLTDGSTVTRRYQVPYEQAQACGDTLGFSNEILTLLSPLFTREISEQTGLYVFSTEELIRDEATHLLITDPQAISDLLQSARQGVLDMTPQQRREEKPVFLIRMTEKANPSSASGDYFLSYDYSGVFPVYDTDSFAITLEMLENRGYSTQAPQESDFGAMYLPIGDGMEQVEITDPAHRQALLDAAVPYQLTNMMSQEAQADLSDAIYLEVNLSPDQSDTSYSTSLQLQLSHLPQGLVERYQGGA